MAGAAAAVSAHGSVSAILYLGESATWDPGESGASPPEDGVAASSSGSRERFILGARGVGTVYLGIRQLYVQNGLPLDVRIGCRADDAEVVCVGSVL